MTNPLHQLQTQGQSVWYDHIDRAQLISGQLQKILDENRILGVTSNPTIFATSICSGHTYDEQIFSLISAGKATHEIYETLVVQDIQAVADLLLPIYEHTAGKEGFVSLEVSPTLAYNTMGTLNEARRLWRVVNRPNLMIKIPATPEGLLAVEEALCEGININVTLILSRTTYSQTTDAYLRALETRHRQGLDISRIASVASCYVSRIDLLMDTLITTNIKASGDPHEQARLRALQGKIALANARLLYQEFKRIFSQPRFLELERSGAGVQRILWASTNTKNPSYSNVRYVEELIGPQTINTMTPETLENFRDHGSVRWSIEEDLLQARAILKELELAGFYLEQILDELLGECLQKFVGSFFLVLENIEGKKQASKEHSIVGIG